MAPAKTPVVSGIVQVFLDEKGRAIAHAADFNQSRYGGHTLHESQRHRVRESLAIKVCEAYSSPQLVRGMDKHDAEKIVRNLVVLFGCRIHEVVIGEEASN